MTFRVSEIGMTHYATVEQEYEQENLNHTAKKRRNFIFTSAAASVRWTIRPDRSCQCSPARALARVMNGQSYYHHKHWSDIVKLCMFRGVVKASSVMFLWHNVTALEKCTGTQTHTLIPRRLCNSFNNTSAGEGCRGAAFKINFAKAFGFMTIIARNDKLLCVRRGKKKIVFPHEFLKAF